MQTKGYCNGPDITVCPLDSNQGYGDFHTIEVSPEVKRTLRSSPIHCLASNVLYANLKDCDKGASDWTKWLEWKILSRDGDTVFRSRRRYCYLNQAHCLYEEKQTDLCCQNESPDPSCPLKHCNYKLLV